MTLPKPPANGIGRDASGGPLVDPTRNVLDLVSANNQRLEELRAVDNRRTDELRAAAQLRMEDLRVQESQHIREMMNLRADHAKDLALAESNRLDAIRAVDVAAVGLASERAATQATVLANQVSASAETLRALVATTASTIAAQLQALTTTLTDRIGLLEKSQYEIRGKSGVIDPQLDDFKTEIRGLLLGQSASGARTQGQGALVGWVLGGLSALIGVGSFIVLLTRISSGH